jgi:hypothetical protein
LVAITATGGAETYSSSWERYLAQANSFYEEGEWLPALRSYRRVRALRADLPQDDEICYRMARCSELARGDLNSLLPATLGCELDYGGKAMRWLWDTYGYYVQESEGDARWVYDKRALRELLRFHPESSYADEAEYVLTKYSFVIDPATPFEKAQTYLPVVKRYERLLERYPNTNLRPDILEEIAFLKDPGGDHPEWIRHYWQSNAIKYP